MCELKAERGEKPGKDPQGFAASSGVAHVGCVEVHCATWHHRRDGVLVDHLRDGIAQQDDVLIERFDLALQLDAVDQIDRHGHMLFAQQIQKWILQKLAFVAHDILRVGEWLQGR